MTTNSAGHLRSIASFAGAISAHRQDTAGLDLTLTAWVKWLNNHGRVVDGMLGILFDRRISRIAPYGPISWLIPGAEDSTAVRAAMARARRVAAANGSVKFAGTLGDGTAVSHTAVFPGTGNIR